MQRILALTIGVCLLSGSLAAADRPKRRLRPWPTFKGADARVFKSVGNVKLRLHIFKPADWKKSDRRPAIVFFFGGGWIGGSPAQFEQQSRYLASRGMVAMSAEYRIRGRHGTPPSKCVADGKSAVRWIRVHAGELGVDPHRIVASGGSAGGHVAACTGILKGLEEAGEEMAVSSVPNAMVLFNPAVDLMIIPKNRRIGKLLGDRARELSPLQHVRKGLPPTIIFHGAADTTVPFESVQRFQRAMEKAGNRCELVPFKGQKHGFFNYTRSRKNYNSTMRQTDEFLRSLGYLKGRPTIGE